MSTPRNAKLALGSTILIGAFAFLVAGGMQSSTLRAMPVSELLSSETQSKNHVGQRLRVVGFVGDEPVRRVIDSNAQNDGGTGSTQYFVVYDETKKISVEYRDALPETFKAGLPVQVDGVYYAPGKLRADRVLTKCPSKYQAEEVEKATNERTTKQAPKATAATPDKSASKSIPDPEA